VSVLPLQRSPGESSFFQIETTPIFASSLLTQTYLCNPFSSALPSFSTNFVPFTPDFSAPTFSPSDSDLRLPRLVPRGMPAILPSAAPPSLTPFSRRFFSQASLLSCRKPPSPSLAFRRLFVKRDTEPISFPFSVAQPSF